MKNNVNVSILLQIVNSSSRFYIILLEKIINDKFNNLELLLLINTSFCTKFERKHSQSK